jgi:hypothetical protein
MKHTQGKGCGYYSVCLAFFLSFKYTHQLLLLLCFYNYCVFYLFQLQVPYYRYLLPGMRLFTSRNKNLGDKFEYCQHKRKNVAVLIDETLQILEKHGGETAVYHIKRVIPLYTSKQQILSSLPDDEAARRRGRLISRATDGKNNNSSTVLYDGRAMTR